MARKEGKIRSPSDLGPEADHVNLYFGYGRKLLNHTELLFSMTMLQIVPSSVENSAKAFFRISGLSS